jgi:alcohol dehydrogenase (cytochrome c)
VVANAQVDPRVRNGALGFTGATQDLPQHTVGGGSLLVFAVPAAQRGAQSNQGQSGQALAAPQPNELQR